MWQILKAEFDYTRTALASGYAMALLLFVVTAFRDNWDVYGYMVATGIIYMGIMAAVGGEMLQEGRGRLLSLLPVRPSALAATDVIYVTAAQAGMFLLWLCLLMAKPESRTAAVLWAMVANSAVIVSAITVFGILHHVRFFDTPRYQRIAHAALLMAGATIAGLLYVGKFDDLARAVRPYYATPIGALACIAMWLALSAVSVSIFVRRRSYLQ